MTEPDPSRRAILAGLAVFPTALASGARAEVPSGGLSVYQLRIYQLFEHNKPAFHDRFRDHAVPIMARHGFDIVAMWEARGEGGPEFVYLLRWPDEDALSARWASFMADPEWSQIKAETAARHGDLVGVIQSRVLRLTSYSPLLR